MIVVAKNRDRFSVHRCALSELTRDELIFGNGQNNVLGKLGLIPRSAGFQAELRLSGNRVMLVQLRLPRGGSVAAEAQRAGIARIRIRQKRFHVRQPVSHGNERQLVARDLPMIGSTQVGRLLQCHH